jgi:hypothetical protein
VICRFLRAVRAAATDYTDVLRGAQPHMPTPDIHDEWDCYGEYPPIDLRLGPPTG